jgi:hypothetical protein
LVQWSWTGFQTYIVVKRHAVRSLVGVFNRVEFLNHGRTASGWETKTIDTNSTSSCSKPQPLPSQTITLITFDGGTDTAHWPGACFCAAPLEHWSSGALEHWSTGAPLCVARRSLELCFSRESQHHLYCPTFTPPAPAGRNWRKSRPAGLLTHWLAYWLTEWLTEWLIGLSATKLLLALVSLGSCSGWLTAWLMAWPWGSCRIWRRIGSLDW